MCAHHLCCSGGLFLGWVGPSLVQLGWGGSINPFGIIYFEKIRVFKASNCFEYISME